MPFATRTDVARIRSRHEDVESVVRRARVPSWPLPTAVHLIEPPGRMTPWNPPNR
jgi:hypothetical protein